ncbi:16S rRNA (guanine(527)-N(7))-methyltransferase RsmG [Mesorhizobium sp. IMUNJ 23232]|uniref:16S rRNA (guanine(527)-N(7))-methyltransferase RsmG n=1 Tax=Mesorhizobium sp. IMUNJ 23232 TaxID=3376064 RepID=UPI0037A1E815
MNDGTFDELVKIAGPVSRETFSVLQDFLVEFQRWNRVTNLVASSTVEELWDRHVLDSAQLRRLSPPTTRWVDLGSGGGFPGLILAILLRETPGAHVHLIESNRKKASFLQTMTGLFALPATVHAQRIEDACAKIEPPQAVSSRALASLTQLLGLAEPFLSGGAVGLFHKGREYRREIEESSHSWSYDLIEHASAVESQSVILEISGLKRIRPN